MSRTLSLYQRFTKFPLGNYLFSKAVSIQAPYFWTIHPLITDLRPGYCQVEMKDRRYVRNHLGTVHAGALCNLSELTGGLAVEATIPGHLRWIPREMTVQYQKKAKGKLVCECSVDPAVIGIGDVRLPLTIKDPQGEIVLKAEIVFYVSEKKAKK